MRFLLILIFAGLPLMSFWQATTPQASDIDVPGQRYVIIDAAEVETSKKLQLGQPRPLCFNGHVVRGTLTSPNTVMVYDRFGFAEVSTDAVAKLRFDASHEKNLASFKGIDRLLAGAELYSLYDGPKAIAAYQRVLQEDPENVPAKLGIAAMELRINAIERTLHVEDGMVRADRALALLEACEAKQFSNWKEVLRGDIDLIKPISRINLSRRAEEFNAAIKAVADRSPKNLAINCRVAELFLDRYETLVRYHQPTEKTRIQLLDEAEELLSRRSPESLLLPTNMLQWVRLYRLRLKESTSEEDSQTLLKKLMSVSKLLNRYATFSKEFNHLKYLVLLEANAVDLAIRSAFAAFDQNTRDVDALDLMAEHYYEPANLFSQNRDPNVEDLFRRFDVAELQKGLGTSIWLDVPLVDNAITQLTLNADCQFNIGRLHDRDGQTAVGRLVKDGLAGSVLYLLAGVHNQYRDVPGKNGDYALHTAARFDQPDCLAILLAFNAFDAAQKNADGKTALDLALENDHWICASLLMSINAPASEVVLKNSRRFRADTIYLGVAQQASVYTKSELERFRRKSANEALERFADSEVGLKPKFFETRLSRDFRGLRVSFWGKETRKEAVPEKTWRTDLKTIRRYYSEGKEPHKKEATAAMKLFVQREQEANRAFIRLSALAVRGLMTQEYAEWLERIAEDQNKAYGETFSTFKPETQYGSPAVIKPVEIDSK